MPTATHKQKVLNRAFTALKRQVEPVDSETRPVLETMLYAVCREAATREQADRAYKNLQTRFFDWNEIRVSTVKEVAEAFRGMSDPEGRAFRVISILQEVFETTYSFDLESLHKKGLKQAQKQLERYQGTTPYVVAATLQVALGGHALPLDAGMARTLRRLEVLDGEPDEAALASLEHLVPKARGPLFCEAVGHVAREYCHEDAPHCQPCPMNDVCPTGKRRLQAAARPSRAATGRAKARS